MILVSFGTWYLVGILWNNSFFVTCWDSSRSLFGMLALLTAALGFLFHWQKKGFLNSNQFN